MLLFNGALAADKTAVSMFSVDRMNEAWPLNCKKKIQKRTLIAKQLIVPLKKDAIQYKWPMWGQYTFILTNGKMYTGLSLVIYIVWSHFYNCKLLLDSLFASKHLNRYISVALVACLRFRKYKAAASSYDVKISAKISPEALFVLKAQFFGQSQPIRAIFAF